jgi:hypothetical protein
LAAVVGNDGIKINILETIIVSGCRVKKSGIVWMTMQNGLKKTPKTAAA